MTWFKMDCDFGTHPKVVKLSDAACLLWLGLIAYANKHLTNGVVPVEAFGLIYRKASAKKMSGLISELVEVRLVFWTNSDRISIEIHDFLDWGSERIETKNRIEMYRARGSAAGIVSAKKRRELYGTAQPKRLDASNMLEHNVEHNVEHNAPNKPEQKSNADTDTDQIRSDLREIPQTPTPSARNHSAASAAVGIEFIEPKTTSGEPESEPHDVAIEPTSTIETIAPRLVRSRPLPSSELRLRIGLWSDTYQATLVSALGRPRAFSARERNELEALVNDLCKSDVIPPADRGRIDQWLAREVAAFITGVRGDDPRFWSAHGPKGLRRWINEGRRTDYRKSGPQLVRGRLQVQSSAEDLGMVQGWVAAEGAENW